MYSDEGLFPYHNCSSVLYRLWLVRFMMRLIAPSRSKSECKNVSLPSGFFALTFVDCNSITDHRKMNNIPVMSMYMMSSCPALLWFMPYKQKQLKNWKKMGFTDLIYNWVRFIGYCCGNRVTEDIVMFTEYKLWKQKKSYLKLLNCRYRKLARISHRTNQILKTLWISKHLQSTSKDKIFCKLSVLSFY